MNGAIDASSTHQVALSKVQTQSHLATVLVASELSAAQANVLIESGHCGCHQRHPALLLVCGRIGKLDEPVKRVR